jgi:hypothetical protein
MYGFSPVLTGTFPAIYASSGDSSSPTLLAAGPDKYAWAPIPVPTRLFYARTAAGNAGPDLSTRVLVLATLVWTRKSSHNCECQAIV